MDYTKLTLAELRNGISDTKSAINRCKEALDNLRQPKTVGLQAMADTITHLLPRARTRFESPGESLHHQERIEETTVARQPMGFGFVAPMLGIARPRRLLERFQLSRVCLKSWRPTDRSNRRRRCIDGTRLFVLAIGLVARARLQCQPSVALRPRFTSRLVKRLL